MKKPDAPASCTAILPLKAKSIRLPDKNRRRIGGRPLYHWILDTLLGIDAISDIAVVVDDDVFLAEVKADWPDARIRLLRQPFASVGKTMNDVIAFVLSAVEGEHFLQTHATNPCLSAASIHTAMDEYGKSVLPGDFDCLFSVTPLQTRLWSDPARALNHDAARLQITQDLPLLYSENSALYLFPRDTFLRCGSRVGTRPKLWPLRAPFESLDIDTFPDLVLARLLLEHDGWKLLRQYESEESNATRTDR